MGDSMISEKNEQGEEPVQGNILDEAKQDESKDLDEFGDYKSEKMGDSMISEKV